MQGEDSLVEAEVSPIRPREVIELDSTALDKRFQDFGAQWGALWDQVDTLPEEHRSLISRMLHRLEEGDIPDNELDGSLPLDVIPAAQKFREVMGRYRDLMSQRRGLNTELTPYRRQDFERLVLEASARISYDSIFDYYRDSNRSFGSSDSLYNTASQLYSLRRFQHLLVSPLEATGDFDFFDSGCRTLESYLVEWEKKGFLDPEPTDESQINQKFGESVLAARRQLLEGLDGIMIQLERYNKLRGVYQHTLEFWYPYDPQLATIQRVLNFKRDEHGNDYEDFEKLDFDPAFIEAAKRHIARVIEEHRTAGHLPDTDESLQAERRRIDTIEVGEQVGKVRVEGFKAPEGMMAVVTPEELLLQAGELLPPDFISGLRAISHRARPEKSPQEDPNVELMGRFLPIFNEEHNFAGGEIEVYRSLFISPNTSEILKLLVLKLLVMSEFMGTLWHEFGHNAHHMMRYDELNAWEDVMFQDRTAVTLYVRHTRKSSQNQGKREDFSESFMLFLTNPALLQAISPSRYDFMLGYFNRRLKTGQLKKFNDFLDGQLLKDHLTWERAGYTPQDVRRRYLSG